VVKVDAANLEAQQAWDGVLFDRFVTFRRLVIDGLGAHEDLALSVSPPNPGDRVLDIGCGFGDTSQRLARIVGPDGSVLGVDIAPRFIAAARDEAEQAGIHNAAFEVHDVQAAEFEDQFDYAFSRFGVMFFANPVPALRNVRRALVPGGRIAMVVWRTKLDNPWLHVAENVVKPMVDEPEETDEPRCGPGPFSMAGADTTSDVLIAAGFTDIAFHRCDLPFRIGKDLDEAVAYNLAIGPAAEVVRLAGSDAEKVRPQVEAALREALAQFQTDDGVVADASTWTVTARVPDV
jgi:SAM-dependent methyltransferase